MYTIRQIAVIAGAQTTDLPLTPVTVLLTDSRQLSDPADTLFVALVTDRNDGHRYITGLYEKGVRAFMVQDLPEAAKAMSGASFILVKDTLQALQQLAAFHRRQFNIPVIGITGSNGKTIVKEWLYQLLKDDHNICRSPKSYNSQVGVPLSVWQLHAQHTLGIFEAGISLPGEMSRLEKIIAPTFGILTNIGMAHDEGFGSTREKTLEKLDIMVHCDTCVVNLLGNEDTRSVLPGGKNMVTISGQANDTLCILRTEGHPAGTTIYGRYLEEDLSVSIPFTDQASVQNAATCWATLLALGYAHNTIRARMATLTPVALRLEIKQGIYHSTLINDFYNSDLNSLSIALHYLNQQHRGGKKAVILSDIEQSGKSSESLYREVSALLQQHQVDLLIGIGSQLSAHKDLFRQESYFFRSTEVLSAGLPTLSQTLSYATILLKGSRSFGFEAIGKLLQQKSHDTVLEINLNNLLHNINFYRAQVGRQTKLMCMVKATGYGSGSSEIAFTLQHHGVDYLAVAYADEGVELRKAGIHLPIMVMSPEENAFDDIIQYDLEPEIFSHRVLDSFLRVLEKQAVAKAYPVHIKLDTGMHRLGFEEPAIGELAERLACENSILVKSVFSHLAGSDDAAFDDFSNQQIAAFERMTAVLRSAIGYDFARHICNSGAITRFRHAHYDMVRLGIGMYGVAFNEPDKKNLLNVSSLKTRISQIKHLHQGDTVGYSRKGLATGSMTIATIPIGYADGFSRKLGNGRFAVRVQQVPCKTFGNICMDMCMVDITGLACAEGDEVVIFENNEDLMDLSGALETIPYEVLTSVSTRVKRVYVQE